MQDLKKNCEILGVTLDASIEEVKQSYRDLVKIWHPDRFNNDPRLQQKAQEKLKEINIAYNEICLLIIDKNNTKRADFHSHQNEKPDNDYSKNQDENDLTKKAYYTIYFNKIIDSIKDNRWLILIIIGLLIIPLLENRPSKQKTISGLGYPRQSLEENKLSPQVSASNLSALDKINQKFGLPPTSSPTQSPLKNIPAKPINPVRLPLGSSPFGGGIRNGNSLITVDNGTNDDALVKIIRFRDTTEKIIRNFYIPAGKKFTANKIPQGQYKLKVAFGEDWDSKLRKFNFNRHFSKTELFDISETKWTEPVEEGYIERTRYSKMDITLHKVMYGNFKSHEISEEDFDND